MMRLVRELGTLVGGVSRFGETKREATAFFQMNHRGRVIAKGGLTSEKVRSSNGKTEAAQLNRLQSETDVASVRLDLRGAGRLHASGDAGATGDEGISLNYNWFHDCCFERSMGICAVGVNRSLKPNCDQGAGRKVLGVVKRKVVLCGRAAVFC